MKQRIDKWDRHFIRVARECALMSKDPSSQIGAVVVKDRRIISTGFNGFPPGIADDDRLRNREQKLKMVVHAELNALLRAGRDAQGATLYLWGFRGPPCTECTKHVLAAGIARVVSSGTPTPDRWQASLSTSSAMLNEAGVGYTSFPHTDVTEQNVMTRQERNTP